VSCKQLVTSWNNFWFAPTSPAPICLFRIFYGFLLLISGLSWAMILLAYTGKNTLFSPETLSLWQGFKPSLFTWLPADTSAMRLWLMIYILAACAVMLGLFTRSSTVLAWIILISVQNHYCMLINASDRILAIFGIPMMLAPTGAMFSLDSRFKARHSNAYAPWAQRLLQLHIAAIYWQAFWSKLKGCSWWDGDAVYYATHIDQFHHLTIPYVFDHLSTCRILTWGTLLIEFLLWGFIWFKEFRYWVLFAGVIMHLVMGWSLYIWPYDLMMITSYINFIYPADLERLFANIKRLFNQLCRSVGSIKVM
jgi:hypothetical protein